MYASLADLKAMLKIADSADDPQLELAINAAAALVDGYAGRSFARTSATRRYTATAPDLVLVPDLVSVTALTVDRDGDGNYEETWPAADYVLWPAWAAAERLPYAGIRLSEVSQRSFPLHLDAVHVSGEFGFPSVPPEVVQATLLMAARIFRRRDAIFGVVGGGEMGQAVVVPRLDPDVAQLLMRYRALL